MSRACAWACRAAGRAVIGGKGCAVPVGGGALASQEDNELAGWNADVIESKHENDLQKCRRTKSAQPGRILP